MPVQALKSNDFVIEKITIDEFHNLYLQSIKGSFYRNDAIKKSYQIEGVVCSDVCIQQQGTSFKIQSDEGNMLNVYLPKKVSSRVHLEPGNKIRLYGMFNLQENLADSMDFIKFNASRVLNSSISESKKETILDELHEKGFLEKPKKKLNFTQLDFFNLMVISSKDSSAFSEIKNCLGDESFFRTTVHYVDLYKADQIAETIKSLDKNSYYDAVLITGISPKEASLFDEMSVLTAIHECNTLIVTAMGNTLANEISDITEDGPTSAAKMLLYEYKEEKYREMEKPKKEEFVSSAYDCLLREKDEVEKKFNILLKENSTLLSKIGTQQKLITVLGVLSFTAVIISLIK